MLLYFSIVATPLIWYHRLIIRIIDIRLWTSKILRATHTLGGHGLSYNHSILPFAVFTSVYRLGAICIAGRSLWSYIPLGRVLRWQKLSLSDHIDCWPVLMRLFDHLIDLFTEARECRCWSKQCIRLDGTSFTTDRKPRLSFLNSYNHHPFDNRTCRICSNVDALDSIQIKSSFIKIKIFPFHKCI